MSQKNVTVFVGGPFTSAMRVTSTRVEFDIRLRSAFDAVHNEVQALGFRLLSSHITDSYGAEFEESEIVPRDNNWVRECDLYVALLPLDASKRPYRSDGTFMEAGMAIAYGKRVLLVMEGREHPEQSYYVRNTNCIPTVKIIDWDEFMTDPATLIKRAASDISEYIEQKRTGLTREHTTDPEDVIARLEQQEELEEVVVNDVSFKVMPGVFSPRLSHAPDYMMANWTIKKGATVLDLGSGCGILGISALLQGAGSLVALDKNPRAVENTQLNLRTLGLEKAALSRLSNIYESLGGTERFDIILLSPPYWNRPASSLLANACYDEDYEFLTGAIRGVKHHLEKDGRVFIIFSNQGDVSRLVQETQNSGLLIERLIIHSPSSPNGHCRIFFELKMDPDL